MTGRLPHTEIELKLVFIIYFFQKAIDCHYMLYSLSGGILYSSASLLYFKVGLYCNGNAQFNHQISTNSQVHSSHE